MKLKPKPIPNSLTRRTWLLWTSVSLLALLCAVLGYLQYRWTGQITEAERRSLYDQLRERSAALSGALDIDVSESLAALVPSPSGLEAAGRESAYAARYLQWKRSHDPLFGRIALVIPRDGELTIETLDAAGHFTAAAWPIGWEPLHTRFQSMLAGERGSRGPGPPVQDPSLFEVPRFVDGREQEWLVAELDSDFIRTTLMPRLLQQFLGSSGSLDYDVDILSGRETIYRSTPEHAPIESAGADAVVPLLQVRIAGPARQGFPRGRGRGIEFGARGRPLRPPMRGAPGRGDPGFVGPARWQMRVRHRAGSLEALVARTRRRNLGISGAVFILILATVSMLVWLSRQSQRLGDLQMRFVAGVSHELRTPLTVIRTCAYNLRSPAFLGRPEQIERYGRLIESESEKLQLLVDQVLSFASAGAGHAVRERTPVSIRNIIEEELDARKEIIEARNIVIDEKIGAGLPAVLGDERALRYALRNLLDNALKYGVPPNGAGGGWIGVHAHALIEGGSKAARDRFVEITVADHGPGIPSDEQPCIFDAFYRGRKPVQDQTHGTGLGLNIVKTIVEAHGGAVSVKSDAANGTEFVVRLPAESSTI